jgi:hypothetical protein
MPLRVTLVALPSVEMEYVPFELVVKDVEASNAKPVASAVNPTNELPPPPSVVGLA